MMFLLLGLGIMAASAASWASILSYQDFSDAILQNGLLYFWWNILIGMVQHWEILISIPSVAVPLLVATVGPFVGIPLMVVGGMALWRRPKEIKVQGRARGPMQTEVFQAPGPVVEEKTPLGEKERRRAKPVRPEKDASLGNRMEEKHFTSATVATGGIDRKVTGIGAALAGTMAALGAAVSKLADRMRQEALLAAERQAKEREALVTARTEVKHASSASVIQATREESGTEEEQQPLPDRIMAWYAAWMTVRAGQRPPRMLEDARRLAAELDPKTRSAMMGFGMRGATALSMLESAASAGMTRGAEEEEGFLPLPRTNATSTSGADIEEFLREVEAPEACETRPQEGSNASRDAAVPAFIEDDITPPAPSSPAVSCSSEEVGPIVIEDDIDTPNIDKGPSSMVNEMAARRLIGDEEHGEIKIPIEERELLPMPGTIEPSDVGDMVVATATTRWDEISASAPTTNAVYPDQKAADSKEMVSEAEVENFLAVAESVSKTSVTTAIKPADEAEVKNFLAAADEVGPAAESSPEVEGPAVAGMTIRLEQNAVNRDRSSLPTMAEPAASTEAEAWGKAQSEAIVEREPIKDGGSPPLGGSPATQKSAEEVATEAEMAPKLVGPMASDERLLSAKDGWPAMADTVENTGSSETGFLTSRVVPSVVASKPTVEQEIAVELTQASTAQLERLAAGPVIMAPTEASVPKAGAESESACRDDAPEAFPSGVSPEAQEAVIGPMLSDPRRRATILGDREGTPTWMLRRLELYGLLGLSDKSNTAVVRMWEALDRLVSHQARVFAWESLKETPPPAFATHEQRAAYVIDLAREVVAERARVGADLLAELRALKAGTEHVAWMDDRVDSLLAAMTSPKAMEQLGDFLPKPEESKVQAGGRLLKVMTGRKEAEVPAIIESPYEDLLAASHDIHQRYKEICKVLMVPIYRSLSIKVKGEDGRPVYAQIELVIGDVSSIKQRSAAQEGAIGIVFALVPSGRWQVAEAAGRAGQDRLVLEGIGENAGRLLRVRDRSLDVFRRWVEGRNMRAFGVVHLLCEEGTVVDGIDRRWGNVEFVRNPWGQKDLEAIQKSRLRPKAG